MFLHQRWSLIMAAILGLAPRASAHVMFATNPMMGGAFERNDNRAFVTRLTRLMDDLIREGDVIAGKFPAAAQPLYRKIIQSQPVDGQQWNFKVEAFEEEKFYSICCYLPGVKRTDIRVNFMNDNVLSITAERASPYGKKPAEATTTANDGNNSNNTQDDDQGGPKYFMKELQYGKAYRSFKLPPDADTESSTATLIDGVLTVKFNKKAREECTIPIQ